MNAANMQQGVAKVEFAQKAVIFDDVDDVLLVARVNDAGRFLKWELPGGRVELHEDLDDGFKREVWEEVGLRIVPGPPVYLWSWRTDKDGQIVAAARIAYAKSGAVTDVHRAPDDGLGEIRWMPITSIDSVPMDVAYREAIKLALSMRGSETGDR